MDKFRLGKTGMMVTRLGFGGIPIQRLTEKDAVAVVKKCIDLGLNYIDTANGYNKGESERIIGKAFSQGLPRQKVFLATKFFMAVGDGPNDQGGSRLHIQQACEDSLRRLQQRNRLWPHQGLVGERHAWVGSVRNHSE